MEGGVQTLGYALLGLLAREPLSGYDLARRMKERVSFFWRAAHSHIYPELARLGAAGLVHHHVVEQAGRPDKKVYSITEAGRVALQEWVSRPIPVPERNDELVLKTYSLWLAEPERAIALFREHERQHLERLTEYEAIQAGLDRKFGSQLRQPGTIAFSTYLTLQRGIGYEREYAAWCGNVAQALEHAQADDR